MRAAARRISRSEKQQRLQSAFQRAAGERVAPETLPHLQVPRDKKPLSLFDWRAWTQARPTLWCYGDACNLYPERRVPLLTREWITCLLRREEMEYCLDHNDDEFCVRDPDVPWEINRFAGGWVSLHLFATLFYLSERHQSAFACLKNGGLKWAEQVRHLAPEMM